MQVDGHGQVAGGAQNGVEARLVQEFVVGAPHDHRADEAQFADAPAQFVRRGGGDGRRQGGERGEPAGERRDRLGHGVVGRGGQFRCDLRRKESVDQRENLRGDAVPVHVGDPGGAQVLQEIGTARVRHPGVRVERRGVPGHVFQQVRHAGGGHRRVGPVFFERDNPHRCPCSSVCLSTMAPGKR